MSGGLSLRAGGNNYLLTVISETEGYARNLYTSVIRLGDRLLTGVGEARRDAQIEIAREEISDIESPVADSGLVVKLNAENSPKN